MTTATYSIQASREFDTEFPLPALTVIGRSHTVMTGLDIDTRTDAVSAAIYFWRQDGTGSWNGGRHGIGNITDFIVEEVN
jgi:hypothetical protein|tara:strand:+ start:3106 stop:3345 length:240 start_codon:yes stop_codon:yes gene_type:complete